MRHPCYECAARAFEIRAAGGEQLLESLDRNCAEAVQHGAGADGGQHLGGVFAEQDESAVGRRLFEDLEQAVGCFFHESRRGEEEDGALRFDRRPVVGVVDHLADLADLDEVLRRVGRDDENVGVWLDEDAGFALVGFAEVVAGA